MKKYILFASALCIAVSLTGCRSQQTATVEKLPVAASFYPLAFLAEQIGGELVTVTQVTPGGVEPHEYEPSPQQLSAVHGAKVFLMNGGGVDGWGDKLFDELKSADVLVVRMTDAITPMKGFTEEEGADAAQSTQADPHLWLDPVLMQREATLVRDEFIQADPAHADDYTKNADALLAKLTALDQEFRNGLVTCAQKNAVVSHNAFRYLAKEYGFQTLAISGLDAEQEPTPKRIAELADFAKRERVKYIFFETLVSPKIAETLAKEVGAEVLVLNPIEGLTPDDQAAGADYFSLMRDNLQSLRTALQCQ